MNIAIYALVTESRSLAALALVVTAIAAARITAPRRAAAARRRAEAAWPIRELTVVNISHYSKPGWVVTVRIAEEHRTTHSQLELGHGRLPGGIKIHSPVRCRVGRYPGEYPSWPYRCVLADP